MHLARVTTTSEAYLYMGPAVSSSRALTKLMLKHRAASVVVRPVIHAWAPLSERTHATNSSRSRAGVCLGELEPAQSSVSIRCLGRPRNVDDEGATAWW